MTSSTAKCYEIRTDDQVVQLRRLVREFAAELGLSLVDQTKMVTAASEIARNTVVYGGGGTVEIDVIGQNNGRRGLRLITDGHDLQTQRVGHGLRRFAMRHPRRRLLRLRLVGR